MCSSGAISLTGRVLKIDETRSKLMGAFLGEQRAVLLPEENRAEAEPVAQQLRTQAPLDMHYVSDVTQVLRTSVIGESTRQAGRAAVAHKLCRRWCKATLHSDAAAAGCIWWL